MVNSNIPKKVRDNVHALIKSNKQFLSFIGKHVFPVFIEYLRNRFKTIPEDLRCFYCYFSMIIILIII